MSQASLFVGSRRCRDIFGGFESPLDLEGLNPEFHEAWNIVESAQVLR